MDAYLPPPGPNLGAACLAGACRGQGIDMRVFDLTGAFLNRALGESVDEIITAMDACRDQKHDFAFLEQALREHGRQGFQSLLQRNLEFCMHPGLDDYTEPTRLLELGNILKSLCSLYSIYCRVEKPQNLKLAAGIADDVSGMGADILGFSVHSVHDPILNAIIRACAGKARATLIAGGRATFTADGAVNRDFFFRDLGMDYCLSGYADHTLPALLVALARGSETSHIPNLHTRERGPHPDACLPESEEPAALPDFSDLDLDRYFFPQRLLPIQTARGCYWKKCAFCRRDVHQPDYFEFSDEHVRLQLEQAVERYETGHLMIASECLHPNQARRMSKMILRSQGLDSLNLMAATRPAPGFDEETLGLMATAGFRTLFWGMESGSDQQLRKMNKGTTVQDNEKLLRLSHAVGISNLCFFLLGFPGETEQSVHDTIEFIKRKRNLMDYFRMNAFMLFPDTAVFRSPGDFGVICHGRIENQDSYDFDVPGSIGVQKVTATVEAIRHKYNENRAGFVNTRYVDPETAGKGDEKLPFFFWQACRAAKKPGS